MTRAGPSAVTILVLAALALAPPRPASADEALVDLLRAVWPPLVVLTPLGRGGFRVAGTMRP